MSEQDTPHVKVTLQTLYDKQLENQRLLVQTLAKLEAMNDIPERVRMIELKQARTEWIERVAYAALAAGVSALVGMIIGMVGR
jgi:hypothetical protein